MKTRNLQYAPPIRDQRPAPATCQPHGLTTIAQTLRRRAGMPDETLSVMFPFTLAQTLQGLPNGDTPPAMEHLITVAQDVGLCPERLHHYYGGTNHAQPTQEARAAAVKLGRVYPIAIDPFNGPATAELVRKALAQGHIVGIGLKCPQWLDELWSVPESEHLERGISGPQGIAYGHFLTVIDMDGVNFRVINSMGLSWGDQGIALVSPQLFKHAITLHAFTGFAGCNDRCAYDADGIPGQVYRLYQAAFNRTPDKGGLGYQIDAAKNGLPLWQLAMNFMASPEGQVKLPAALTNAEYVDRLYDNVLHRTGDAGGIAHHLGNLNAGIARHDVLMQFSESPENKTACAPAFDRGVAYT